MAFSVHVFGITKPSGRSGFEPDAVYDADVHWPARELMKDPRFREVFQTAGYKDFVGVFTSTEAASFRDQHGSLGKALEAALASQREVLQYLVVHIYEWESGFG